MLQSSAYWKLDLDEDPFVSNVKRFASFLSCIIFAFLSYRLLAIGVGDWSHNRHQTSLGHDFTSFSLLLFLSVVLYHFGNYKNTWNIYTAVSFFISLYTFGALGQWHTLHNSLNSLSELSATALAIYISAILVFIALSCYHMKMAYNASILRYYIVGKVSLFGYIGISFLIAHLDNDHFRVHLHHWILLYTLAFFTRFPNLISRISAGICLGLFVHGLTAFGPTSFLLEQK